MINAQLVGLLRCPESLMAVRVASEAEIAHWNEQIAAGKVFTPAQILRSEKIVAGLLRVDGNRLFPVENGIPVMLIEEALVVG